MRVIIVEDELMLCLALEDLLISQGHIVSGVASDRDTAAKLAREAEYGLAILDVNLKGQSIEPVADQVRKRGIPMVFVTGYGRTGVPEGYRHYTMLAKPYTETDMVNAIERALSPEGR